MVFSRWFTESDIHVIENGVYLSYGNFIFFLHIYEIISTSYSFYTGIDHAYHAALLEGVCLEFART